MKNRQFKIISQIISYLPKSKKIALALLVIGVFGSIIIEIASLGLIAIFAAAVNDLNTVIDNSYFQILQSKVQISILKDPDYILFLIGGCVIFLIILKNYCKSLLIYFRARFAASVNGYFGENLLGKILHMPYEWYLNQNSADMVLAVDWRRFFGDTMLNLCIQLCSDIFLIFLALVTLIVVTPVVSLTIFFILGSIALITFISCKKSIDVIGEKTTNVSEAANRKATTALHGCKEAKIYERQPYFIDSFKKDAMSLVRLQSMQKLLMGVPVMVLETAGIIVIVSVVLLMPRVMNTSTGEITGIVVLVAVLGFRMLPTIVSFITTLSQISSHLPYVEKGLKYFHVIGNYHNDKVLEKNQNKSGFIKNIVFQNVSYSYPLTERKILEEINLEIKKGHTIGIIGKSGAGKSTFVDLLLGLLSKAKGKVLIDGVEINDESIGQLLSIGYVSQSPYICDSTIAENIAFGINNKEIDFDRIVECCHMAAITDFLNDLPEGIHSQIGERGVKLSGGQAQRIAIARALYKEPDILVFDEATSALDKKTEKLIQKTVYSFKGKKTLIIIAHRLSTVEDCDSIIWIDKGNIVMNDIPSKVLSVYN